MADGKIVDIRVLARTHIEKAIAVIAELMGDPEVSSQVRLGAAEYMVDRCYGRPAQAIHISESGALDDAVASALAMLDSAVSVQATGKGSSTLN